MNKIPFYQHFVAKIKFDRVKIDENLVDLVANNLIDGLKLTVVNSGKHEFSNNGLTKFWILSQSHMVIHSWPENDFIHIDLMTCNCTLIKEKNIEDILQTVNSKEVEVTKLEY